jgi:predicted metalloprotease with PDZ domain
VNERSLSYVVSFDTTRHLVRVRATFRGPLPEPLALQMPAWTPGSYLVREYARHVEQLRAHAGDKPCGARKTSKDAWAIAHGGANEVVVEYAVYAHELTVRTNHVSESHGYFNGAATFLRPIEDGVDWDALPVELELVKPDPSWSIATGLSRAEGRGENVFRAKHFDELVDCPVDVGVHERHEFTVEGKPHAIVLWGSPNRCDRDRLVRDVTSIVQTEATLFGGLPYEHYLFLLHLAPGGRGGLEHENSTALLASPDAFESESAYDDLLSLFAHEFFHLWQVKRTRPSGLRPYRYDRENYTRMLWLFEGGTSYYDWFLLRRSGLVTPKKYLEHLASEIARLEDTPGRFAQSLEEASFDAWVKLYRPDEHSVNSTVSYYLKGEIACAMIDLELRARSKGERSFDHVLQYAWKEFGQQARGIPEDELERVFAAATGVDVSDLIDSMVRSTQPFAYDEHLAKVGLTLRAKGGRGGALGVRTRNEGSRVVLSSVLRDSAAERAGLSPGDEIIAIDGRRVEDSTLRRRLEARKPGESVELIYARRDFVRTTKVVLAEPSPDSYEIVVAQGAPEAAKKLGAAWLGPDSETLWNKATS